MNQEPAKTNRPPCPSCGSQQILKNGSTHHKKPKFLCKTCGRQFLENPQKKWVSKSTQEPVKKLLLERISLRGIARCLGLSISWLQRFITLLYRSVPYRLKISEPTEPELEIECDELWSYTNSQENAIYIWLAIARKTRKIVGFYWGDRGREAAQEFWETLPDSYQKQAQVYTDLWESYQTVIPPERHHPGSKRSGETTRIERFNNTLRQRGSRLVRKPLSFSKNLFNHEGAILYFIHHYNEEVLSG